MATWTDNRNVPLIRTPLPGPKAADWIRRDQSVISPSAGRVYPLVVQRGAGAIVEDVDGNIFLDCAAGIAVCSTGHAHPEVVAAISRQAGELIHIAGALHYYSPMVQLAEKLATIAPWRATEETRVYLGNSGTEAVEAAMKLARWHTGRKYLLSFEGAFHGRTLGALSLNASKYVQKAKFGPLLPMVASVPYGEVRGIADVLFRQQMAPDEVAAIFIEPIQGEGGYRVAPPGFLQAIRELCDRHGILMVADEIQSGVGRTGKWWACEHDGVVPDMICSAKGIASGMPISALITKARVMTWTAGAHGTTYGGNPVCCAAALATIDVIEREYMANAAELEGIALPRLHQIAEQHGYVANPRGRGLMLAVDIVEGQERTRYSTELRNRVVRELFNRGVLTLPCGEATIRIIPPLCITREQLRNGLNILDQVVAALPVIRH
ncbi:MAG: 5-aminovalerate aminotransferase DavT [Phycisphaerae bacterium]|nr:5-aminovalerate aminotransferase DavT [Phycisphaerae bacterium]